MTTRKPTPATLAARALRAIPSEARSEQSRANGRKGGRPRLVVTYAEAYRTHVEWQLCREHAADTDEAHAIREELGIGPLGPVQRGARRGSCAVCRPDWRH